MFRMGFARSHGRLTWLGLSLWLGTAPMLLAADDRPASPPVLPLATNIFQLHQLVARERRVVCAFQVEGVVCATEAAVGRLVLQDNSGAELIGLGIPLTNVLPGHRVRLQTEACIATLVPSGLAISQAPLVNNDGLHGVLTRSESRYLGAGLHPIRLDWYNALQKLALAVTYQGPGLTSQPVPASALFRDQVDPADGQRHLVNGLDYRAYEGEWGNRLPDFNQLTPVKTGTVTNFDIRVRTREERVGLEFSGYLAVPTNGVYRFDVASDDGAQLFVGEPSFLRVEQLGWAGVPLPKRLVIGQAVRREERRQWAEVEGTLTFASEQRGCLALELRSGVERMRVTVANGSGLVGNLRMLSLVRVRGVSEVNYTAHGRTLAGELFVLNAGDLSWPDLPSPVEGETNLAAATGLTVTPAPAGTEPLFTTVADVKRLKRDEALRGYKVRLRGVITQATLGNTAVVIQDETHGIFVTGMPGNGAGAPRVGERWEIEGVTGPGDFAPVVVSKRRARLGPGRLPEPVRATWDQLMNGSLDTQYVELQGIVTRAQQNRLELLLREGKIQLALPTMDAAQLAPYEQALVRVRGVLFPAWDKATHRLRFGEMLMGNPAISVDEPAPEEMFSLPLKRAAELLLFDLQASAFQRVKVAGQIVGERAGQYFLQDGTNGVRFVPREPVALHDGDRVEVVGFVELVGPSPVLREAVARTHGHAGLPAAQVLNPESLLGETFDATRVRIEGVLVNWRPETAEQVLEMQFGLRTALARLPGSSAPIQPPAVGSVLELTGVYLGLGGDRALGRGINSFELVLGSTADIRVLSQPPWWTMPRLLMAFGAVGVVLLGAMLWVLSLRRQVRAQTSIIRQKVQREAALEERARIAKDIHDEVGSSLTLITMLGERSREDLARPRELAVHTDKIVAYARAAVQSLDEIVWAVNPQNDTLDSLVGYLNQFVARFFESTSVRCRLEVSEHLTNLALASEVRHDLFLVVREALNNVLKHARASEVRVAIIEAAGVLEIAITDDGKGFEPGRASDGRQGNGLENMSKRMARIGGGFRVDSAPGASTTIRLTIPLATRA